ncbi:hypothetical protein ASZ90_016708 [hydrocarbon metagenome]|uniref:DUF2769 domain-containing protein n=1 Tax=hydrocarbon metagenome TaxID=938273 RepID=A0A0W8EGR7_9ZZZZ
MDKFMEMAKKMEQMSPDERKHVMMKNRSMCICSGCPTYTSCMKEKNELLFCSTGKSACAVEMKACICPTCPVTNMMGLSHAYYCAKGSEKELRGM